MEQLIFPVTKKEAAKSGRTYSSKDNKNALFPTRLRDLRNGKGISQETLAHDIRVSKSTIGLYETGDTLPDAKTLRDLVVYFGVSADWILGLSDVRTLNIDIRKMCEYTGLSEDALAVLAGFKELKTAITKWDAEATSTLDVLNLLFYHSSSLKDVDQDISFLFTVVLEGLATLIDISKIDNSSIPETEREQKILVEGFQSLSDWRNVEEYRTMRALFSIFSIISSTGSNL